MLIKGHKKISKVKRMPIAEIAQAFTSPKFLNDALDHYYIDQDGAVCSCDGTAVLVYKKPDSRGQSTSEGYNYPNSDMNKLVEDSDFINTLLLNKYGFLEFAEMLPKQGHIVVKQISGKLHVLYSCGEYILPVHIKPKTQARYKASKDIKEATGISVKTDKDFVIAFSLEQIIKCVKAILCYSGIDNIIMKCDPNALDVTNQSYYKIMTFEAENQKNTDLKIGLMPYCYRDKEHMFIGELTKENGGEK